MKTWSRREKADKTQRKIRAENCMPNNFYCIPRLVSFAIALFDKVQADITTIPCPKTPPLLKHVP